jgi:hypothetical protein
MIIVAAVGYPDLDLELRGCRVANGNWNGNKTPPQRTVSGLGRNCMRMEQLRIRMRVLEKAHRKSACALVS